MALSYVYCFLLTQSYVISLIHSKVVRPLYDRHIMRWLLEGDLDDKFEEVHALNTISSFNNIFKFVIVISEVLNNSL